MIAIIRELVCAASRLLRQLASVAIRLWQVAVSPFVGDACRFHPSCSAYALQALEAHGLLRGLALSARRILRCNSLSAGGFDPVPCQRECAEAKHS